MSGPADGYALVTGGAVRLGAAIVRRLAQDGWPVVIHCRSSVDEGERLAAELRGAGARAGLVALDLSQEDLSGIFTQVEPGLGHCGLLVNNASAFEYDDAGSVTAQSFDAQMAVNLRAPILLARHFRAQLPKGAPGVIVNLLDQKVFNLNPDFLSYTLTKTGLEAATRLLAMALAPDIRVCGVAPGLTLRSGEQSEESFQKAHARTALGRGSTPHDIADAVSYVARAGAMTGTTLIVDGGQSLVKRTRDVMFSYGVSPDAPLGPPDEH